MKKMKALPLIALLAACMLAACQPTPTKPVIANKADGKLDSIIKSTEPPQGDAKPTDSAQSGPASSTTAPNSPFPAPASLKYDLPGVNKGFIVQVDAPVEVPKSGVFPVIKATSDVFSQQTVDRVREALIPGVALYQPTDIVTKAQYQTMIDAYSGQLTDAVEGGYGQLVKDYKRILKDLMAKQAKAPETVELKPADMTLHFREEDNELLPLYGKEVEIDGGMRFEWTPESLQRAKDDGYLGVYGITPYQKDGCQRVFSVRTWREGASPALTFQWITYDVYHNDNYISPAHEYSIEGLSQEAATAKADELLRKIGLPFQQVSAVIEGHDAEPEYGQTASHAYVLTYKRDVGTVAQNDFGRVRSNEARPMNEQLNEETIRLTLDKDGFQGFNWQFPVRVLSVENPNVKLMSFDEIKAIFDKQIVNQYEARPKEDEDIQTQRLVIYRVTLSAMPVRIQNEPNAFRYIPVWDFCGKLIGKYADDYPKGTSNHYVLDGNNERVTLGRGEARHDTQDVSFLTVNAIDGSIIDRGQGY